MTSSEKAISTILEYYDLFSIELENTLHITECAELSKVLALKIKSTHSTYADSPYFFWTKVYEYIDKLDRKKLEDILEIHLKKN